MLQDLSPAAFDARVEHNKAVLAQLAGLPGSERETLSARMFEDSVRGELEALELGCHLYPINSIGYGGVHANFIEYGSTAHHLGASLSPPSLGTTDASASPASPECLSTDAPCDPPPARPGYGCPLTPT